MTKQFFAPFAICAVAAISLPSQSIADVSAQEVWDIWRTFAESTGQTINVGSQETTGDALILHDVKMVADFPDGSASGTISLLEFRERGDGTVAVTMAPDIPLSISVDPADGEAVDLAMIFRQTGLSVIASGQADDISFDYLAANIAFSVDKLVVDGDDIDPTMNVSLDDVDGKYKLTKADQNTYASELRAGNVTYDVAFADPQSEGSFTATGSAADFTAASSAKIDRNVDMNDPTALFNGSVNMQASFSGGASSSQATIVDKSDNINISSSAASSNLNFSIVDGSISYGGDAKDISYIFQSPQIPFPEISAKLADLAFKFLMPMRKSNEPEDFGLLVRLGGVEISDMIWSMFDPAQIMPRDSATVELDASGKMNWLIEISDPEQAASFEGENPALLHSLDINSVVVSALGAEVAGKGSFTFNNDDLATFDGMPAPTGSIDFRLVGVNGLLDRLIQMGLLPDDQAMGFRMMLGLFARPADGEDTMTSTVEVKGDGQVFANGQQLR